MNNIRVGVVSGGLSEEHEVSIKSGKGVISALNNRGFEAVDILVSRSGEWLIEQKPVATFELPNLVDVCFIALHGTYGEDGQVQALLDELGIPYTGSGAKASALTMNKMATKERVKEINGIHLAQSLSVKTGNFNELDKKLEQLSSFDRFVIKPNENGSSFGVKMISSHVELISEVEKSLEKYDSLIIEQHIDGAEYTCGVVERLFSKISPLPIVEIIPPDSADFFDTEVKYSGETKEICPANIAKALAVQIQEIAVAAHSCLNLQQYSRSDFIVESKTGHIYYLETNTLPGLTSESLFPKEIVAAGKSYEDLVCHLVCDANRA